MYNNFFKSFASIMLLALISSSAAFSQSSERLRKSAEGKLKKWENPLSEWKHISDPAPDSIKIMEETGKIILYFPPALSYYPFREESCSLFINSLGVSLGRKFR